MLLVGVAVSLLAACSSSDPAAVDAGGAPTTADGSTSTSTDPAGAVVDDPFCVALDRYREVNAEAEAVPDSPTGELTAEQAELLRTAYIPALEDLLAATPTELREPLDFMLGLLNSRLLPADDPGWSQVLADLLVGDLPDADVRRAFVDHAVQTCALDDDRADLEESIGGGPGEPSGSACSTAGPDLGTIDGQERLLTVEDVTSIEAFERNCPQIPSFGSDNSTTAVTSPCGGSIPPLDATTGPGASYGIGFAKVIEQLPRPGEAEAAAFLDAVRSGVTTGCPSQPVAGANGGTTTASDVVVFDLPGIDDPHVAFTAHVSTQAAMGTQTGIPVELELAVVTVQHGDELLVLGATGQDPFSTEDLAALTAAAIRRAGW